MMNSSRQASRVTTHKLYGLLALLAALFLPVAGCSSEQVTPYHDIGQIEASAGGSVLAYTDYVAINTVSWSYGTKQVSYLSSDATGPVSIPYQTGNAVPSQDYLSISDDGTMIVFTEGTSGSGSGDTYLNAQTDFSSEGFGGVYCYDLHSGVSRMLYQPTIPKRVSTFVWGRLSGNGKRVLIIDNPWYALNSVDWHATPCARIVAGEGGDVLWSNESTVTDDRFFVDGLMSADGKHALLLSVNNRAAFLSGRGGMLSLLDVATGKLSTLATDVVMSIPTRDSDYFSRDPISRLFDFDVDTQTVLYCAGNPEWAAVIKKNWETGEETTLESHRKHVVFTGLLDRNNVLIGSEDAYGNYIETWTIVNRTPAGSSTEQYVIEPSEAYPVTVFDLSIAKTRLDDVYLITSSAGRAYSIRLHHREEE
jgi:hypothetical protein